MKSTPGVPHKNQLAAKIPCRDRAARKVNGAKVQKFAGHRDFRTTLNYIHLEDDDMADVAISLAG
jgi:integrase